MFSFNSKTQPYYPQSSTWPAGRLKEQQASIAAERKVSDNAFAEVGTGAQGLSEKIVGKKAQRKLCREKLEPEDGAKGNGETEIIGEAEEEAKPNPEHALKALSQSGCRQLRGHESRLLLASNARWIAHSDVSAKGGRRKRHHQRQKGGSQGGGPFDGITEDGPSREMRNTARKLIRDQIGGGQNSDDQLDCLIFDIEV